MGVVPESVKLLIGVHYNVIPLLLEPALSLLGAGHLITFGADQPTRISQGALAAFSDFYVRDIHSYPQARYFTHGLTVYLTLDLSIAGT